MFVSESLFGWIQSYCHCRLCQKGAGPLPFTASHAGLSPSMRLCPCQIKDYSEWLPRSLHCVCFLFWQCWVLQALQQNISELIYYNWEVMFHSEQLYEDVNNLSLHLCCQKRENKLNFKLLLFSHSNRSCCVLFVTGTVLHPKVFCLMIKPWVYEACTFFISFMTLSLVSGSCDGILTMGSTW